MSFELELIGTNKLIFSFLFFPFLFFLFFKSLWDFILKLENLNISMRKEVEFNYSIKYLKG
jgi:hypothetical protein